MGKSGAKNKSFRELTAFPFQPYIFVMSEQRLKRSLRVVTMGIVAGALLSAVKLTAGILGNSYALIADAIESMADVFSALIVWRGSVVASAPADADHPYGHGKAEPIASAIVAAMLMAAAIGIGVQAVLNLHQPRPAPAPFTLVVLLIVIAIKESLFRVVFRTGREIESSILQTEAWHHRSDAITSLAAAIGIGIALIGPAFRRADSIAAIIAAVIIALNGAKLFRNAINELMDTAPSRGFNARIQEIASRIKGVDEVEKCIVRKMGYHYFVDMHVQVDPKMTVEMAHHIAHEVKDEIRRELPSVSDVLVHIEPSKPKSL